MKVHVNSRYIYHPNLLDLVDGRTGLKSGDLVRVKNLHGCPRANTMGHCHVVDPVSSDYIGLVSTNSLYTKAEYIEYLKVKIVARAKQLFTDGRM